MLLIFLIKQAYVYIISFLFVLECECVRVRMCVYLCTSIYFIVQKDSR
jgi:hypothetical protein